MDSKLGACKSSHVLRLWQILKALLTFNVSEFFELEVEFFFFCACTQDGHQSHSRHFGSTPCLGVLAAALAKPTGAESPIVSDHHINLLQTSSSFSHASIASCVSPRSLPVRRMSPERTSASDTLSDVSCSSSCSLGSYFKRRRLEMTGKRGNTFEGMQENLEFENFEKVFGGLRCKLDAPRHVNRNSTRENLEWR